MTGPDHEFEDFLRQRRALFGRSEDDLEPPAELDRIVLRQARAAIESDKPQRVFRAPSWSMPVALAATLVLAFTIILNVSAPTKPKESEVTVQNVARKLEYPATAAAPTSATEARNASRAPSALMSDEAGGHDAIVVDLSESSTDARAAAPAVVAEEKVQRAKVSHTDALRNEPAAASAAAAVPVPEWRRDSKTWLAEIERLRATGDLASADAELAEYKREHRAYAGAPDR